MSVVDKACTTCKVVKPLSDFYAVPSNPCGVSSQCKPCKRASQKAYYMRNREMVTSKNHAWAKSNPDKRSAIVKRWDGKNPDRSRRQREANPEAAAARQRRWAQANKAALAEAARRRRARIIGTAIAPITVDQLSAKRRYWGDVCWMCGDPSTAMDHVKPLAKGGAHMLSNLRPACNDCNLRKGSAWPLPSWCHTGQGAPTASEPSPRFAADSVNTTQNGSSSLAS